MNFKVYPDYSALSIAAAAMIIECVKDKPDALLCFATGDTPKLTYQIVSETAKKDNIDFSRCFIIGLDEWLGIPPGNTGSCHHFLHQYIFFPLAINSSQFHLFNAMTTNEKEECENMDKIIQQKGPIDFMIVGVGMNGHIGFNEPGSDLESTTRTTALDETTRTVGQKYFQAEVPISKGITLGLKQVMQAETVLMIANGKKKAPVIKQAMESEISKTYPASFIRMHKNSIIMTDNEAASEMETSYE